MSTQANAPGANSRTTGALLDNYIQGDCTMLHQSLQVQVSRTGAITGLAYWLNNPEHGAPEAHFLNPELVSNALIKALAAESVALLIGGEEPDLAPAPGWYPASRSLIEVVETYQRVRSIGSTLSFNQICDYLPPNELMRLLQAVEILMTYAIHSAHVYTVAAAAGAVRQAATRRGLLDERENHA